MPAGDTTIQPGDEQRLDARLTFGLVGRAAFASCAQRLVHQVGRRGAAIIRQEPARVKELGEFESGQRANERNDARQQSCVGSRNSVRAFGGAAALSLFRAEEILEFVHELPDVAEGAVHRGEPDVGHLVQPFEFFHDDAADFFGAHLLLRPILEGGFDGVGHRLDRRDADRALLTGLEEAGDEFLPFEASAVETLPPAPDDLAFLAFA
jgi:hypothetical protein